MTALGKEKALGFFLSHLNSQDKVQRFYALIGVFKAGGQAQFERAIVETTDERILYQRGCRMDFYQLRQAAELAVRDQKSMRYNRLNMNQTSLE